MHARVGIGAATVMAVIGSVLAPTGVHAVVAAASNGQGVPSITGAPVGAYVSTSPRAIRAAANLQAVPVRSSFETPTRTVYRDIGISVVLPDGHELWIFGDTNVFQHSSKGWTSQHFIDGSSAILAHYTRGQVPHGGEYPTGTPGQFLPLPQHVYLPDGTGRSCIKGISNAAFPARWATGAAVWPTNTSDVLITYSIDCVYHPPGLPAAQNEGWGYVLYNWRRQRFDHGPVDVFKPRTDGSAFPTSEIFGSPVFDNGQLTLFSSTCQAAFLGCSGGSVSSVTLAPTTTAMDNPASYQSYELRQLSTDGSSPWAPLSVSVGQYPTGWRLIEWTTILGNYSIFSTSSLTAPWHLEQAGTLPNCQTHNNSAFCFALVGHPELSTPTKIFISYVDPNIAPVGHVVISAVPD
ncbi:MAG TPA: hypothetical protein VK771_09460 [Acidimicrobiia bacterium]|nr:hypothetical protein [Acidimicrobiia bacterium]